MSQDEPVEGPTGEYRKETVKKLEEEKNRPNVRIIAKQISIKVQG